MSPRNRFDGFFLGVVRMSECLYEDASADGVICRRLAGVERAERMGETASATTGDDILSLEGPQVARRLACSCWSWCAEFNSGPIDSLLSFEL